MIDLIYVQYVQNSPQEYSYVRVSICALQTVAVVGTVEVWRVESNRYYRHILYVLLQMDTHRVENKTKKLG